MKSCALAIIFNNKKDSILLIRRRDIPIWVLPGGGIEENETGEHAVIREVFEETSLIVEIKRKIAEYSPINRLSSLTHTFECEIVDGKMSTGEEAREIEFIPFNKLPKNFFFLHHIWLQDAFLNDPKVIQKPISQVTYFHLLKHFISNPILTIRAVLSRLGVPLNFK
jgi:8-oxo-dGTP diphosphatase